MEQQIKISAYLTLDSQKESDIIKQIQNLIDNRQLSNFVTNIVKFGLENPSLLEKYHIDKTGVLMASSRSQFFKEIKQRIEIMDEKIERIERIALKSYELGRLGKKLGIEEKAENSLKAEFILKRQLKEIKKALGYSDFDFTQNWGKTEKELNDIEEKAEEFLEYVIEHYDGIVNEIIEDSNIKIGETKYEIENNIKDKYESNVNDTTTENKADNTRSDSIEQTESSNNAPVVLNMDVEALDDFFN